MHDMSAHAVHHGAPTSFIRKHVFSLDHKVIGKQYYALALVAVVWGMVLSWIMRIHLGWGNYAIPGLHLLSSNGAPGNVMTPEYYLQLMTMHGTIMVYAWSSTGGNIPASLRCPAHHCWKADAVRESRNSPIPDGSA